MKESVCQEPGKKALIILVDLRIYTYTMKLMEI